MTAESTSDTGTTGTINSTGMLYDPNRAVSMAQLEAVMNLLVHPVWIFDLKVGRRMRWGNQEAVEFFNCATLQEFVDRDFTKMSEAVEKRNDENQAAIEQGQRLVDQWTYYPKGQAKTVRVTTSGICLLDDIDIDTQAGLHVCFLCEAVPMQDEVVDNNVLRGVEMLRHLPIAVCQFDTKGNCMFQNPEACLYEEETEQEPEQERKQKQKQKPEPERESDPPETNHKDQPSNPQEIKSNRRRRSNNRCIAASATASNDTETSSSAKCTHKRPARQRSKRLSSTLNMEAAAAAAAVAMAVDSSQRSNATHSSTTHNKRRKRADGNLLSRFVDPAVGTKFLHQILQTFANTQLSTTCLELEAMLHTRRGPIWSAVQVRQSADPVTGESVLLFNARDKSDAVEARKEKRAREQKAEFLAIMAHEIRTPLHQVTGFVDLLDQTQLDKEQRSFVGVLKTSVQGLMTVTNDVLDYSKLEAGHMKLENIPYEPLAVAKGSLEAVRAACEERNLYLQLDWDTRIPFKLKNDPNRLRQILLNLLSNSVKFTKKGGITVRACYLNGTTDDSSQRDHSYGEHKADGTTNFTTIKENNHGKPMVKFTVSDTGIGISEEHKKVIFQKYQQANATIARNYGGTGLGLSISNSLVEMMGGSMGVESQVGNGATLWFLLPAVIPTEKDLAGEMDEDETTLPTSPTATISNGSSCTPQYSCQSTQNGSNSGSSDNMAKPRMGLNVLVAEDNKVNQKLVVNMLRRLGHTASVAENGKEAIEMIEKGGANQFDICLMDIQVRTGGGYLFSSNPSKSNELTHHDPDTQLDDAHGQMPVCDGFEATKRLRSMGYTDLPIYGLTASMARSDFVELGFNDWLPKPIRLKDLKVKLNHLWKLQHQSHQEEHEPQCKVSTSLHCVEC
ncbi:Hybrid signal transduction histidine kinase [Seminavis robusta]|uniref:Hybrid signal transduction histidine kinase n=1 Tax=Seminavis robusta TaxID=568900 RepID=A0A9N8E6W8_9STRA|nr:Hybrid signal transduction histidine kinase [Seminavis robusta]|eukprot:Sro728_g193740.1 Hybrid signal transduction histidine kinase (902) ;mRNA; r:34030-36954